MRGLVVVALCVLGAATIVAAVLGQRSASRARRELARVATIDTLTGLPNRSTIEPALATALASAGPERPAVVVLGLSRFEVVNATYGLEVGDAVMGEAAFQLEQAAAPGERVARLGGPQFVVVLPHARDRSVAEARARELQAAVQVPYRVGTDSLRIAADVGIAVAAADATAESLLTDGLLARQEAEERGPGTVTSFDLSFRDRLSAATVDARLAEALENDEFWLHYLPVVAIDTCEIVGVEALLRWAHPERGMLGPTEFLAPLEASGLIVSVGTWAVGEACRQSRVWLDAHPSQELLMTVNVSPRQLYEPGLPDVVRRALDEADLPPERLCLELTGATFLGEPDQAWSALRELKDLGVKLALDDFGIGYSSLDYLRRFELDILKVDRAFVTDIVAQREDEAIVRQLVGLAHDLGIAPVAEGVDDGAQAQILRSVQCDYAQGYWYSAPQPPETMEHLLAAGRVRPGDDGRRIDWSGAH